MAKRGTRGLFTGLSARVFFCEHFFLLSLPSLPPPFFPSFEEGEGKSGEEECVTRSAKSIFVFLGGVAGVAGLLERR